MFKKTKIKRFSNNLNREVKTIVFKSEYFKNANDIKILILNDGQDMSALKIEETLHNHFDGHHNLLIVAIEANDQRLYEYGVSSQADYKNRGNLAKSHEDFVVQELIPYINQKYIGKRKVSFYGFAGFSLGGLSAFDIAWTNAPLFTKVGVFSGSFWWRSKAYQEGYLEDHDRIMHQIVKSSVKKDQLKFWFEVGTNDEKSDRNNNGIIDSIDDTQDLIKELNVLGYNNLTDIVYLEVKEGEHNFNTWSAVFPIFLDWFLE